jgi:aspartate aminotransferase
LREAVAANILQLRDVEFSPDQIVIIPGGKVAIFFTILMFGEPGAEILYPDPGFPIFRSVIEYSGATAVAIPLNRSTGFVLQADDVLSRITPRTRLLIVNSPANPTGAVTPRAEQDKLAAGLEAYPQVTVLSDEIYGRICYPNFDHVSWLSYEALRHRVIVLDGWSKTYAMTGWRLGYCVLPVALVEPMLRFAINCHTCANAAAQHAGIAALAGPQDAVERMISEFDKRRRILVEELNAIRGVTCGTPGGAFYVFPDIEGTGQDAQSLQDRLLNDAGVATIAGSGFGARGSNHLRISFVSDVDTLKRAAQRMRAVMA